MADYGLTAYNSSGTEIFNANYRAIRHFKAFVHVTVPTSTAAVYQTILSVYKYGSNSANMTNDAPYRVSIKPLLENTFQLEPLSPNGIGFEIVNEPDGYHTLNIKVYYRIACSEQVVNGYRVFEPGTSCISVDGI